MGIDLPERQIVGLHNHDEMSLLDGILSSDKFLEAAKKKGLDSFAITNHGNMASALGFFMEAKKQGIKPIFGIEIYVAEDISKMKQEKDSRSSHLVLIARNDIGFHNLLKISNLSWTKGFYYRAKIDLKHLKDYSEGLTALTACLGGSVNMALRFGGEEAAIKKIGELKDIFKDQLYLEIQLHEGTYLPDLKNVEKQFNRIKDENIRKEKQELLNQKKSEYVDLLTRNMKLGMGIPEDYYEKMHVLLGDSWIDQSVSNKFMYKFSKKLKIPLILTGDCHYPEKGQHILQDLIIRVGFGNYKKAREGSNDKSASTGRGYYSSQLYIKNNKDFDESRKKWHTYLPKRVLVDSICSTHIVADQINVEIPIGQHQLPTFPVKTHMEYKKGDTKDTLFERLISDGFEKLIIPRIDNKNISQYKERLKFETETIKSANFVDYFLIIEDIVRWSRRNGIRCVARGSVAGSIVAYALDITGIDPIEYNLLFERFINPTRVSGERAKAADALPDIDLDFERFGRNRIKNYIVEKYGSDRVCTIGSYGTMGVKMLVKDFARVLDYKIGDNVYDLSKINKLTTSVDMGAKTIEDACESSQEFANFYEQNKGWFETYVRPLQGEIRTMSKHAAGVIITPTPFTEWIPIRTQMVEDEEDEDAKVVISQWQDTDVERRGLLKIDVLGVKQLDVFHMCEDLIKKNHNTEVSIDLIDTKDKLVFERFHAGDNFGVFQFNSALQSDYMRRMKPDSVEDLCVSNAILRPGPMQAEAHIDFLHLKTGEENPEYDHKVVIPYLKNTFGLMIYQEQLMQVAHALGGLTLAEADMMRSAIKKKDEKLMDPFFQKFVAGCVEKGLSKSNGKKVWDKILFFSNYGFNKSHAATYALQGYYCQWLKTYFPVEFFASTMEFAADDAGKNENIYTHRRHAVEQGIKVLLPSINRACERFGVTKKGSIEWPLRAVKGVGDKATVDISQKKPFKSFEDFFERVTKRLVNKNKVEKLICANVFGEFGTQEELMIQYFKLRKEKQIPEKYIGLNKLDWKKLRDEALGFMTQSYKKLYKSEFEDTMDLKRFNLCRDKESVIIGGMITKYKKFKAKNGEMAFVTIEDLEESYNIVMWASFLKCVTEEIKVGQIVKIAGLKGRDNRGAIQVALGTPRYNYIKVIA